MKEYIAIYNTRSKSYSPIPNCSSIYFSTNTLYILFSLFEDDFRSYTKKDFYNEEDYSDINFFVKNMKTKTVYISQCVGEDWCNFPEDNPLEYCNETNSCNMSIDNFESFIEEWENLIEQTPPFALLYRDNNNWVHLKQFNSEKEMNGFIKQNSSIWQQFKFWIQLKKNEWAWKLRHKIYKLKDLIRK